MQTRGFSLAPNCRFPLHCPVSQGLCFLSVEPRVPAPPSCNTFPPLVRHATCPPSSVAAKPSWLARFWVAWTCAKGQTGALPLSNASLQLSVPVAQTICIPAAWRLAVSSRVCPLSERRARGRLLQLSLNVRNLVFIWLPRWPPSCDERCILGASMCGWRCACRHLASPSDRPIETDETGAPSARLRSSEQRVQIPAQHNWKRDVQVTLS